VPQIVGVEFLSEQRRGVGTRFRETWRMGKRRASTELEVTEYVPNQHVRLVTEQGGTVWDTVFRVKPAGGGAVELELVMEANARTWLARLLNPLIKGMVRKAIEGDLDADKAHCEGTATADR
jgi:hypothetical protein